MRHSTFYGIMMIASYRVGGKNISRVDVPKESIQKHKRAQSCYAKDTSDRDRPVAMLNAKATDVERMGPRCIAVQIKLPIPTSCAELICQLVDGSQWKGKARSRGLETMVKPHCG